MIKFELSKKKVDELINWNWIGIIGGSLSLLIAIYNIHKYYEQLGKKTK